MEQLTWDTTYMRLITTWETSLFSFHSSDFLLSKNYFSHLLNCRNRLRVKAKNVSTLIFFTSADTTLDLRFSKKISEFSIKILDTYLANRGKEYTKLTHWTQVFLISSKSKSYQKVSSTLRFCWKYGLTKPIKKYD